MSTDDEKTLNTHPAGRFASAAALDARIGSDKAYNKHREFFDNPEHSDRVDAVRAILNNFFKVKDMYENSRPGRNNPHTVIKITNHLFPRVPIAQKEREYTQPLADLGVKPVQSKGTNSYLYRIF